eukprot:scaffold6550_cov41-Phaeocystis_antarctica.AAC.1
MDKGGVDGTLPPLGALLLVAHPEHLVRARVRFRVRVRVRVSVRVRVRVRARVPRPEHLREQMAS